MDDEYFEACCPITDKIQLRWVFFVTKAIQELTESDQNLAT